MRIFNKIITIKTNGYQQKLKTLYEDINQGKIPENTTDPPRVSPHISQINQKNNKF